MPRNLPGPGNPNSVTGRKQKNLKKHHGERSLRMSIWHRTRYLGNKIKKNFQFKLE